MSVLGNLNWIQKATFFPCAQPNPVLIAEAALSAITPVLLNAASFGCRDIVKMRAGRSPWHSRGVRMLVEGAIKAEEKANADKLLKFTIPIERALFFWFVVDLTVDFFARWQSQVFRLGACGNPLNRQSANGPMHSYVEPAPNGWVRIAYLFAWNPHPFGSATDFFVPDGWFYSAFFSLTVKGIFSNQPVNSCTLRLREIGHGGHSITGEPATPDWFGNPVHAGLHLPAIKTLGGQRQFVFEAQCDVEAIGTGGSATVEISNLPLLPNNIIPVNCFGGGPESEIRLG